MMRSVQRILAIFDSFDPTKTSLHLHEIVDRVGLSKATTSRILKSLTTSGYLVRRDNQAFCLSHRFVRLAAMVDDTLIIRSIARPIMVRLSRQCNEAISLSTARNGERLCIDVVEIPEPLKYAIKPGEHIKLTKGATAKVLMASLPPNEQRAAIRYAARIAGIPQAQLATELARINEGGYAVTYGETAPGLAGFAVPIVVAKDKDVYALTLAGPTIRLRAKEKRSIRLLTQAALDIAKMLRGERVASNSTQP